MLKTLVIGFGTMSLCLLLQSMLLVQALRYYVRHDTPATNASHWSTLLVINCVMILLVLGNLAQLTIWAVVFLFLGEFDTFGAAVYHSAVNFATLGYGDLVMSERNRFLGPLEAINGVLMVGVSTAALMATFQNAFKKSIEARQNRGN
jgi:ion channel